jgi:dolichyl-phosphate-mannose-protein mannosyltransferase
MGTLRRSDSEFTFDWWAWMLATGFFMACAWSSKVNGILTVVAIGIAVVVDLWDLLDYRKSDNVCVWSLTDNNFFDV